MDTHACRVADIAQELEGSQQVVSEVRENNAWGRAGSARDTRSLVSVASGTWSLLQRNLPQFTANTISENETARGSPDESDGVSSNKQKTIVVGLKLLATVALFCCALFTLPSVMKALATNANLFTIITCTLVLTVILPGYMRL